MPEKERWRWSGSTNSKINPEKLRICRHQTPWNQKGWTQEVRLKFRRSPPPLADAGHFHLWRLNLKVPRKQKNRFQSISVQALSTSSDFCQLLLKEVFHLHINSLSVNFRYFRKASNMKNGNKSNKGKSRITILKETDKWSTGLYIDSSFSGRSFISLALIRDVSTQEEKPTHSIFTHPTLEVSVETLPVSFSSSFKLAGKVINLNLKKEVKELYTLLYDYIWWMIKNYNHTKSYEQIILKCVR